MTQSKENCFKIQQIIIYCCLIISWSSSVKVDPKIINGKTASRGQFPWQVGFVTHEYYASIYCGGAIISKDWVLTTAECAYKSDDFSVVLFGSTGVKNLTFGGLAISEKFIPHDNYTAALQTHNIALVKLRESLSFNEYVQPIELSSKKYDIGTELTVSGWGLNGNVFPKEQANSVLKYVPLTTISNEDCLEFYVSTLIYPGIFCAVNNLGKNIKGVCNADEGAPLIVYESENPVLVGVHSIHSGCTRGEPSIHVNIFYYRDWIMNTIGS